MKFYFWNHPWSAGHWHLIIEDIQFRFSSPIWELFSLPSSSARMVFGWGSPAHDKAGLCSFYLSKILSMWPCLACVAPSFWLKPHLKIFVPGRIVFFTLYFWGAAQPLPNPALKIIIWNKCNYDRNCSYLLVYEHLKRIWGLLNFPLKQVVGKYFDSWQLTQ